MATLSVNGAKGHHKFTLTVTEGEYSVAANTSPVSFSFVLSPIKTGWNWAQWGSKISYSVAINGTTYTGTIPNYDGKSTVTLKTGSQTVAHNADGTKTISISFSVTDGAGQSYTPGNASASGTMALAAIPRFAKLLTAPNFSSAENPTITYSNPAGEAVSSLQACIMANASTIVQWRDIPKTGTSYTFNLTGSEKAALQNLVQSGNSATVLFVIQSRINTSSLSSLARTFSLVNANPIVTASVVDTNETTLALTGDSSKLIRYYSNAKATMSATPQEGAAINEDFYIIRNGNNTGYGKTHTFNGVESNVFTFSAEDSRGNVGTASVTADMVEYVKLTCNMGDEKIDGLGNITVRCSGIWFSGNFSPSVTNTIRCQYRYKVQGGSYSNWADMTVATSGNSYTASAGLTGLDYKLAYSFEAKAIDLLDSVTSTESGVRSLPLVHWGENDWVHETDVQINGNLTVTGNFTSNQEGDQTIDGNLDVTGDLRLKGSGNYGNTLRFGDGNYCYITEPEDDVLHIKASRIDLFANGIYAYGEPVLVSSADQWIPYLNSAAVSSYTVQRGWYQKIGQYVTVGFFVKATCKPGYNTTNVTISGLPFTPLFQGAGGGVCSGVLVNSGFNFQSYVAELAGNITTRVQACNNTTSTSLATSASGCFYPSAGGEITLGGTISYMANS